MLVPPWWGTPAARPAVRVQVAEAAPGDAPAPPSGSGLLGAEAVVSFDWQVAVGDLVLDRAEFERLVALKTPLVQVQGRWVEFRPGEVETALRFWSRQAARPSASARSPACCSKPPPPPACPSTPPRPSARRPPWPRRSAPVVRPLGRVGGVGGRTTVSGSR